MNIVKKLTIFTFILLLCLPPMGVFAAKASPLDYSDVMDDLEGLKLGDLAFDEANYPIEDGAEPQLLGICEYGWQTDLYSLYIFIYNPDVENVTRDYYSTVDINYFVYKDSIGSQPLSSWLWNVMPIDQSDDGRFLKFKVDGSLFASSLSGATKRNYAVEIDMRYYDHLNQDPYSGNDESVKLDISSRGEIFTYNHNGTCVYRSGETIELKVNPSMYKSKRTPEGDYMHQMIYTAYFTIPKKYVEEFDALVGIEATWDERHTAPVVVTNNDSLYSTLQDMANSEKVDSMSYDTNFGMIVSEYSATSVFQAFPLPGRWLTTVGGCMQINGGYSWSSSSQSYTSLRSDLYSSSKYSQPYAFNQFDTVIKIAGELDDFFVPTIGSKYDINRDGVGDLDASFLGSVDKGFFWGKQTRTFTCENILEVKEVNSPDWTRLFWFGGIVDKLTQSVEYIDPFYYLDDSDMAVYSPSKVNDSLYIGEEYWSDFFDTYLSAKGNGDQVVLFRFASRDYYSAPARYVDGDEYGINGRNNCVLSYGTAFLDFDIIKLSFSKDAKVYEFNVNADPIDFVPGVDSPNPPGGGINNIWDKLIELFQRIAKLIGGALVVIVVVVVLKWFLNWLALRRR